MTKKYALKGGVQAFRCYSLTLVDTKKLVDSWAKSEIIGKKINAIREVTRLGKDFGGDGGPFKFSTEFVYHIFVDMWQEMDEYSFDMYSLWSKYISSEYCIFCMI